MNNTGITNLADGTLSATSTDAVTGKQLNATNTRVTTAEGSISSLQNTVNNIGSSVGLVQQSAAGKDITVAKDLDGDVVDFTGKKLSDSTAFSRKLTGLADGTLSATSTDAVTGKQLNATNTRLTTAEGSLSSNTTSITNLQNTVKNISSGSAGLVQQSAAGKDITVAKDLDGDVVDFSGKKLSDSTAISRKLTGLADGTLSSTSTDAVSGKQLYATNQGLASTNKDLANTNTRLTTAEGSLSSNTTNITNLQNTVKNISSGSVGLVQQSAAGKDITVAKDLDGDVVDFSGKKLSDSTAISRKLTGLAEGTLSSTSTDAVTGKQLNATNTRLTTAEGNLSSTTTSITNLQNTVKNISSGSVGLVQQSAAGKDITVAKDLDGDVVDFSGKKLSDSTAFSRKLTGLAEGTLSATSTDAVSGKQLYTTNQGLASTNKDLANTNTRLTTAEGNLSSNTTNITNLQNTVKNISSGSVGLVQQSAAGKDITVAKDLDGDVVDFTGKKLSDSTTFSRKLTGLAEGTLSATSTDAVSGKQLYTTNQGLASTNKDLANTNTRLTTAEGNLSSNTTNITNLQNTVKNISSGSVGLVQQSAAGKDITVAKDLDGDVVDFSGKKLSDSTAISRKLTGLADGTLSATSTDAVSGKQLYTTNQNLANTNTRLTTAEGNLSSNTTNITNLQNTVKNISSGSVGLVQQSAAGKDITVAKDLDGDVVDFSGKKLSDSTAFSRKLTGLADGTLSATSTDAVSGKQLYTTNQNLADTNKSLAETNKTVSATTTNISNLQNTVNNISNGSVGLVQQSAAGKDITVAKDLDGDVVDFTGKKLSDSTAISRKLTGLAEGTLSSTSTDAVSGKQLYTTNQNLANTNTRLTTAEGSLSSNTTSITNLQNTVKNISSGSVGLVQQSAAGKDITVAKDLDGDVVDFTGKKLSDSTAFSRKLTGLADGTLSATSTDAVTGKQLNATNTRLTTAEGSLSSNTTNITNLQNTVKNISSGSAGLVQQSAAGKDITVAKDLDGDVVDFSGKKLSDSTAISRKLTGLADGTLSSTSTDAVTGKQLNATNTRLTTAEGNLSSNTTSITNLQNTVKNISSGSVGLVQQSAAGKDITVAKDLDGDVVDFSGKKLSDSTAISRKLTGLADGTLSATSTDAVSGKQLYTTNQNLANTNTRLTTAEGNLSSNTTNITNLQNTVKNISSGSAGLVQQSAAGKDITVAKDLDGDVVDFSGKKLSDSTAFSRKLTGLAEGTLSATSTDAVSGKQLYTTNQNLANTNTRLTTAEGNLSSNTTSITNLQNTVKNISSGSVGLVQQSAAGKDITVAKDLDGDVVDFSGKKLSDSTAISRKLTGLADGTLSATSTDAVTGSQLYATNKNVANVSDNVTNIKNTMNTIVNGGGLKYFHANSTLDDAQATGLESIAFGGAAVAAGINSMAMGGNARAMAGNAVALGAGSVADRANTVSVGSVGKERQITNVASGTADTDAVNVAQLKAAGIINGNGKANAAVTYGTKADGSTDYGNVTLGGGNASAGTAIHNVAAGTADTDAVNVRQMNAAIAGVQKVSNTSDPMFVADGDRAVKRAIAQGTHATAMGAAASAGGDQSIAAGHNAQSGGDSSIAMGANAKATANHAVAMGDGSVADRANTMSVGSAGNERQVTNVAAGVQGTDAVNVSQLSQTVYAAVGDLPAGTTAKQYTDEQVGMVRQGVNQVARGAYSGIAAATALTMIPDVDQGKTIAVGIGAASYKGYQAVALGASARIAQNLKAKMGVGYSSEGTTVGVGASYQW
ncbi:MULTISPECIES: YadA-like family protein [Ralstonia solanacearum species complex]|uniref:YadA-like family protein n=1 Tax=Ralstonia solanacearum species complex TaxID=3116862 RepID=UPI001F095A3A|nr:YadA-like family protein [Ralstonia solanacearum]